MVMDMYEKERVFPSDGRYFKSPVRCHYHPKPIAPLLMYFGWSYLTAKPILMMLISGLGSGITGVIGGLALLAMAAFMMNKLVEITTISKGSDYGSAKTQTKKEN
jgi:lysophosphatidic acid acyltransferase / lysophosphatidylinositol acyltransferase